MIPLSVVPVRFIVIGNANNLPREEAPSPAAAAAGPAGNPAAAPLQASHLSLHSISFVPPRMMYPPQPFLPPNFASSSLHAANFLQGLHLGQDNQTTTTSSFEDILAALFSQHESKPRSTPADALESLPRILLTPDDAPEEEEYSTRTWVARTFSSLSTTQLKSRLRSCGHDSSKCVERRDLEEAIGRLTSAQLKQGLKTLGADTSKCIEKSELLELLAVADPAALSSGRVECMPFSRCFQPDQDTTCTMCFDELKTGHVVTRLGCGHWFHLGTCKRSNHPVPSSDDTCPGVLAWLRDHSNCCPNCKTEVVAESALPSSTLAAGTATSERAQGDGAASLPSPQPLKRARSE